MRRERAFTLVECMVGVVVLSLMAVGFVRLAGSHERIVADLEIARGGATSNKIQRRKDPYQRVLGARAQRTGGTPRAIDDFEKPSVYFVDVTSVEHRPPEPRTTAVVQLTCYAGQLDATPDEVLQTVWGTSVSPADASLDAGTYSSGVFTSDVSMPFQEVEVTTGGHTILTGTYYAVTDLASLNTAQLRIDPGGGNTTVNATSIGMTTGGLTVWEFVVPADGVLERMRFRVPVATGTFTVSLIAECVLDDLL